MTTIHDDEPGSRIRELEGLLLRSQLERDALALRKDELESVLAVGRLGFCRLDEATRTLSANSQFKAEFGWPPDAEITWNELEERIQRADRERLADAVR
ncbi:MAG TPA: hypothetical protein VI653_18215, partial [Steroidobacteraceae bacterium]